MSAVETHSDFSSLGLVEPVLRALEDAGYEAPTPIQAQSIPPLLTGRDLLGQAQTGTGKTAAFALPLLSRVDLERAETQLLVLAPTRELAIQVAEAFQTYARYLPNFHVLPIYGGGDYGMQLRSLKRGAQVVVGTPGRVMDHMRRETLKLDALQALVLDEADEMLRMGFIDDVEWILEQTPAERQVALFSATMPDVIRRVARKHLKEPVEVKIAAATTTAQTIRQRYWRVSGLHKLDALTRLLEVESFEGMLIFVRTKNATVELAERLAARGHSVEALNGDIPQNLRERVVERLKNGQLDIVVATDVAARGLDVERISHVVNFDIPHDTEAYVHRIGRTGRAGRSGEAILFVSPREQYLLRAIERATRQPIEPMAMPTAEDVNSSRIARFKARIGQLLAADDLAVFEGLVREYQEETGEDPLRIAAALARFAHGDSPFLLNEREARPARAEQDGWEPGFDRPRKERERPKFKEKTLVAEPKPLKDFPDVVMERFRLEVGYQDGVKPGNIVGAIANEADLDSRYIGHIELYDDFSTIDLPEGMPDDLLRDLRRVRVCGKVIDIKRLNETGQPAASESMEPPAPFRDRQPKARPDKGRPPRGADTRRESPPFAAEPSRDTPRPRRDAPRAAVEAARDTPRPRRDSPRPAAEAAQDTPRPRRDASRPAAGTSRDAPPPRRESPRTASETSWEAPRPRRESPRAAATRDAPPRRERPAGTLRAGERSQGGERPPRRMAAAAETPPARSQFDGKTTRPVSLKPKTKPAPGKAARAKPGPGRKPSRPGKPPRR